jgi:diguanylate cyclase (GGDEF)-like protein
MIRKLYDRGHLEVGTMLDRRWVDYVECIDYAFQPIINIHTGVCYGVEALMRGQEDAGFQSIEGFFDAAYNEKCLFTVDMLLRERAIKKFSTIDFHGKIKLFYNVDNRVLLMPDYTPGFTSEFLEGFGLNQNSVCFEISERHELVFCRETADAFNAYKQQTYKIAIDDFGTGFSGLRLLYHSEPDFIKIDRFFIAEIENDPKKRLFVSNVIKLAHVLGIQVIAEGVETEKEFYVCHDMGCDLVQGYLIQRPMRQVWELHYKYEAVAVFNRKNRRRTSSDERLIYSQMEYLEPIAYPEHSIHYLFEAFRKYKSTTYLPVVNRNREPLGIVREKELKEYVYSPYGKDLLRNQGLGMTVMNFLTRTPVAEITTAVENILEICTMNKNCEAIIVTENGKYIGYLSMLALLNVLNEKNLAIARDQNPLTKLPGNTIITSHIARSLENREKGQMFVYFDFDNFKPFNDVYGFRRGDRAIVLFADLLKEVSHMDQMFVGHIGGDDFFASMSVPDDGCDRCVSMVKKIVDKFRDDVINLYDDDARKAGHIEAKNREGTMVKVPLLTVSAAILFVCEGTYYSTLEDISQEIATLKHRAKKTPEKVAFKRLTREMDVTDETVIPLSRC